MKRESEINHARAGARPRCDTTAAEGPAARILLAVDVDFNGCGVRRALERQYRDIDERRLPDAVRPAAAKFDVILLCCNRSGPSVDLLQRITTVHPLVPVIIVTSPARTTGGAAAAGSPLERDAGLQPETLLRSVRDALREPRIKRLIRVPGEQGSAQFAAGNARWLAEDLQARYGTPFQYSHEHFSVPIRFGSTEATQSPPP